jgi:hypothetical protein
MKKVKIFLYAILVLSLCNTLVAKSSATKKKRKPKKSKTERALKKKFKYTASDIQDYLVFIKHENGSASGFVAKIGEHYYILTNQHVLLGANKISFKTISGNELHPKKVELSTTRDIARLLLDMQEGLTISGEVKMNAPIALFGDSDGAGVVTELYGTINGIGSDLIEVSANFVAGNSGSPLLNPKKEAIGIASYVRFSRPNRTKEGTKFENKTRRFCYRIKGSDWMAVNWGSYNKKYGMTYLKNEQLITSLEKIYASWKEDPTKPLLLPSTTDRTILAWAKMHNNMIKKYHGKKKFSAEFIKSLKKLSTICRNQSKKVDHFLAEEDRFLTAFLRKGFRRQAYTFSAYKKLGAFFVKMLY